MHFSKDPVKRKKWIEKLKQVMIGKNKGKIRTEKVKRNMKKYQPNRSKEKNSMWIDGRAWKSSLHRQIEKIKGKANKYKCVDCPEQALDWSSDDHSYSLNPNEYKPRCRSCHQKHDFKYNNRNN